MTSVPHDQLTRRDVIRLYSTFNRQLAQIVRCGLGVPERVIEDACQVAWTGLIGQGQGVDRRSAGAWLVRTALREALRLARLEDREPSLEQALEDRAPHLRLASDSGPEELISRREQVCSVRLLSARQQRLVWLHALGFSCEEMASYEQCTSRTVRRQLERARRRLRMLDADGQAYRQAA
jgi:RNA polymerase sigma factor (sigma-70 family)